MANLQAAPTFDWSGGTATYKPRLEIGDPVVTGTFPPPFGYNVLSGTYKDVDQAGIINSVEDQDITSLPIGRAMIGLPGIGSVYFQLKKFIDTR